MNSETLIILGSARKNSDTKAGLEKTFEGISYTLIDLLDYKIYPYQYGGKYPEDDAFPEITDILLNHRKIVFATPVYWYAMSGLMKTVFDRFTDLVTINKSVGRQLKGKSVFLFAVGADEALPPGFEIPFKYTATYLEMNFAGYIYQSVKFPSQE